MKKILAVVVLAAALPQLAHATYGSCNFREENICVQYDGSDYSEAREQIEQACQEENGEFSNSACPSTRRLGQCHISADTTTYYIMSFYPPTTSDDAKTSCSLMGGRYE